MHMLERRYLDDITTSSQLEANNRTKRPKTHWPSATCPYQGVLTAMLANQRLGTLENYFFLSFLLNHMMHMLHLRCLDDMTTSPQFSRWSGRQCTRLMTLQLQILSASVCGPQVDTLICFSRLKCQPYTIR